ncbi:hypothetical protein [Bacillus sp. B15-48]|uniref:hypothetical protein n=1 Tax=Bacillus sp. B15-48 TaxID=1548601 RepID=UPI00193F2C4C|nr:hypothetical protein [Bacillus sp. B15-48]MBM4762307.1 hypothetical protein [Bacillus sp. B15-48]
MKKLAGVLFIILVLYSIYNDFNYGSLPTAGMNEMESNTKTQKEIQSIPYFEQEIFPGDTVLSILENELNEPIPVPISEAVADFKKLNEGLNPEEIKYGRSYKFPDYRDTD